MPETAPQLLAGHTTMRVGGPARSFVVAETEAHLIDAVRSADAAGEPVLVLGGGSNMLVADEGFDGTVIKVATRGIDADESGCTGALVTVAAGEPWDDFVAHTIDREWSGLEALSGIPGLVGATPIQNVGAYGAEVSTYITQVRTLDRHTGDITTFSCDQCEFGYRMSRFKASLGRWLVLSVSFQFRLGNLSAPIQYAELARRLGAEVGQRVPAAEVRRAVLALRTGKGMVLDPDDHDTWSAGSFFTNPILTPEQAAALPEGAPRFAAADGRIKSSAAWLIDHAGFGKGFAAVDGAPATLSTKHTLALTNRGSATAQDLLQLARTVREGVRAAYGITLVPEPVLVGCSI